MAEVVADRALLEEIWDANPLLRQYLGTVDNPALIVYRVRPTRVRFMREWALDYHDVPANFAEVPTAGAPGSQALTAAATPPAARAVHHRGGPTYLTSRLAVPVIEPLAVSPTAML